jgi:hypothetical protein
MTSVEELLSISSEGLAPKPQTLAKIIADFSLGPGLFDMLGCKNGFYALESALHVFPLTSTIGMSLEEWNADTLWRNGYQDLAEGLLFFAEDVFQNQFCLAAAGVLRFDAETGTTSLMADSIEDWAKKILGDHRREVAWPLASKWQAANGPLPTGKRLMPKIPFFLGGEYSVENLWAGDSVEGMRFKADLALQTRKLPDGSTIKLVVGKKPYDQ